MAFRSMAKEMRAAMLMHMWDAKNERFCDGICTDAKINGSNGEYTNMYSLYLGFVPAVSSPGVWSALESAGLESMGDYGAYAFQAALSDFDEFGPVESGTVEANGGGDDGDAMLHALTKCDDTSWCAMWEKYNATMTREAFPLAHLPEGQTMSHAWGAAAIPAIVQVSAPLHTSHTISSSFLCSQGIIGIQRQSPCYATFKIKPRLGSGLGR
jgi:hypothetical protein